MGYDLVVIGPGDERLAAEELLPDERQEIAQAAAAHGLRGLMALPDYWGDEHEVQVHRLDALLRELSDLVGAPSISPVARRVSEKIRGVALIAKQHGLSLLAVPD